MKRWRSLLLALAVIEAIAFVIGLAVTSAMGDLGISTGEGGSLRSTIDVTRNGPAYAVGLRTGDKITSAVAADLELIEPRAYEKVRINVIRDGSPLAYTVTAVPRKFPLRFSVLLRTAIGLILLLLGSVVTMRAGTQKRGLLTGAFLVMLAWSALAQYISFPLGMAGQIAIRVAGGL